MRYGKGRDLFLSVMEDDRPMSTRGVNQYPNILSVPVSDEDKSKLDKEAEKRGMTRSQLIRRFIHEGLRSGK